ncbi:hypothetical protein ACTFIZ_011041 [Dictyostelium cf. discoideum]
MILKLYDRRVYPANPLPPNHPQKNWSRHHFYSAIGRALLVMGFTKSQHSMYSRYWAQAESLDCTLKLHLSENMSWLPHCLKRMHVVKLVTIESLTLLIQSKTFKSDDYKKKLDLPIHQG